MAGRGQSPPAVRHPTPQQLWARRRSAVTIPPPPLGDQEGRGLAGIGKEHAARPRHPTPHLPGARRGGRSAATVLPPPPTNTSSQQQTPLPATILLEMFDKCVARGIAAKLTYKTVGGRVETSLFCSTASAAAAADTFTSRKKGRKRPENERRKARREAWLQRRCALQSSATVVAVSEGRAAVAAAATAPLEPAALETVSTAPATAAEMPSPVWAWERREGLSVIARRIRTDPSESPETVRDHEGHGDLNLSTSSWTEDRDYHSRRESPKTYATAAAKTPTPTAAAEAPGPTAPGETSPAAEERAEKGADRVYRPPPTPPPMSKFFSDHHRRVLCTFCFAGNHENWNAKCADCYGRDREEYRKLKESQRK